MSFWQAGGIATFDGKYRDRSVRAEEGGGRGLTGGSKGKGWIGEHQWLRRVLFGWGGGVEECYGLHGLFPVLTPYSEIHKRGVQFWFSVFSFRASLLKFSDPVTAS